MSGLLEYLFNELQSHNQLAGTTRTEIQGNIAAGTSYCISDLCLGVGYGFSPDALHLSVTTYDAYAGITTVDGQPRGCKASLVCLNSVPIDGMKQAPAAWGPYRLAPPKGLGEGSFGAAIRANSSNWKNAQTPYRFNSTSNTFIQLMLTPVYGSMQRFNFSPYQAPGYEGK